MKKIVYIAFLSFFISYSQEIVPRLSPRSKTISHVGYTEIIIDYGSPGVKGRKVFGELESYNVMWRAGANEATTISFSTDVLINGHYVPKGKYSFFIIPEITDEWVIVFNKDTDLNGTTGYKKEHDQLRLTITPEFTKESRERLIYDIQSDGIKQAKIQVYWSLLKLPFIIEVDFEKDIVARLQEMKKITPVEEHWKLYYDLVDFYLRADMSNKNEILWIEEAESRLNSTASKDKENDISKILWAKARVLAKNNKVEQAKLLYSQLIKMKTPFVTENVNDFKTIIARW